MAVEKVQSLNYPLLGAHDTRRPDLLSILASAPHHPLVHDYCSEAGMRQFIQDLSLLPILTVQKTLR